MEAGTDILTMHLCQETAPENQKFILQEVSERSPAFLALGPQAAEGAVEGELLGLAPGGSQGCNCVQETGGFPQAAGSVVGVWHPASGAPWLPPVVPPSFNL